MRPTCKFQQRCVSTAWKPNKKDGNKIQIANTKKRCLNVGTYRRGHLLHSGFQKTFSCFPPFFLLLFGSCCCSGREHGSIYQENGHDKKKILLLLNSAHSPVAPFSCPESNRGIETNGHGPIQFRRLPCM